MDYDSDSSDFHFPSVTGLAKLSSPLSFKVPESRDWALDEFMQTLQEKPYTAAENLLSFRQYIPVQDNPEEEDDDFLNYGPPKLSLPTPEEKEFLSQLSHHFLQLERTELHEILKGGFTLVQNDIQSNNTQNYNSTNTTTTATTTISTASTVPGLSWFNEAVDYGKYEINNLDTVEMPEHKSNFSPFEEMSCRHGNKVTSPSICSEQQVVSPQVEEPLPALVSPPSSLVQSTTPTATTSHHHTKKGFKYKLKQFVKPFNSTPPPPTTTEKSKTTFIKNTKKFIRNIF